MNNGFLHMIEFHSMFTGPPYSIWYIHLSCYKYYNDWGVDVHIRKLLRIKKGKYFKDCSICHLLDVPCYLASNGVTKYKTYLHGGAYHATSLPRPTVGIPSHHYHHSGRIRSTFHMLFLHVNTFRRKLRQHCAMYVGTFTCSTWYYTVHPFILPWNS